VTVVVFVHRITLYLFILSTYVYLALSKPILVIETITERFVS